MSPFSTTVDERSYKWTGRRTISNEDGCITAV